MNSTEKLVQGILEKSGFSVTPQYKSGWEGLFGQPITVDFFIERDDYVGCIELKYQNTQGTAEQKIVYSVEEIKRCHELPTTLVLFGNGFSNGCISWLHQQEMGNHQIFTSLDDFADWVLKQCQK